MARSGPKVRCQATAIVIVWNKLALLQRAPDRSGGHIWMTPMVEMRGARPREQEVVGLLYAYLPGIAGRLLPSMHMETKCELGCLEVEVSYVTVERPSGVDSLRMSTSSGGTGWEWHRPPPGVGFDDPLGPITAHILADLAARGELEQA